MMGTRTSSWGPVLVSVAVACLWKFSEAGACLSMPTGGRAGEQGPAGAANLRKPMKIALEGNIAAGKSTLLKLLEDEVDFVAVPEPLSKWQKVSGSGEKSCGGNLLELFYKDPKRWGYTFQTYAFLSRMSAQMAPLSEHLEQGHSSRKCGSSNETSVVFFERSVFSDRYIFAENCAETGLFNDVEWGIYQDWHSWLLSAFENLKLDGIIYLRTSPSTCLNRLKKRARSEEGGIPLNYLEQIHGRHERWLKERPADLHEVPLLKGTPILVLNCDDDFVNDPEKVESMKEQIRQFLSR